MEIRAVPCGSFKYGRSAAAVVLNGALNVLIDLFDVFIKGF